MGWQDRQQTASDLRETGGGTLGDCTVVSLFLLCLEETRDGAWW